MDKENKAILIMAILVSTSLGALGQLLFKSSLLGSGIESILLIAGLAAYGISTIIYLTVLSRTHLSWAYGLNGLSYVFAVILAVVVLHDTVTTLRWMGVAAIAIGAVLVGWS